MFEIFMFFCIIIYLIGYSIKGEVKDVGRRNEAVKNGNETYYSYNSAKKYDVVTGKHVDDRRIEGGSRRVLIDLKTEKIVRDITYVDVNNAKKRSAERGYKGCYIAYHNQFPWIYEGIGDTIYVDEITGKPFKIGYHFVQSKEELIKNGNEVKITYYEYYSKPQNGERYGKYVESPFVPGKYTRNGEDLKA